MSVLGGFAQEIFFTSSTQGSDVCGRLFLGSAQSAAERSELAALKVQLVVNCTNDEEVPCFHEGSSLRYLRIAVNDNESAVILPYLDGAADMISRALDEGQNVLVHCRQGISRSATVLAAFLIKHCGLTTKKAIELIQSCRPVANPNLGFRSQLQGFEEKKSAGTHRAKISKLDEEWCYISLASFSTGETFTEIPEKEEPAKVVRVALDFVLGRGIKDSDVRWFGSLLATLNSSCNALELLWQELTSEHFKDCWGADFSPTMLQQTLYVSLQNYFLEHNQQTCQEDLQNSS